ncbi:hypothetical protein CDD83_11227 [Cordyceps sp. RAO-2017]|nr:hypothetical protein CDD83_11227 [Cordyceps sp. RAO-2017]
MLAPAWIHLTTCGAYHDERHWRFTVIIDSILQILLLALPALVIIGWLMDRAMDLFFEPSQAYTLLFSVILVNQVLQDRHYTYLHGAMLLSVYVVVAAAHFIAPQQVT